jgi:plastocyanin
MRTTATRAAAIAIGVLLACAPAGASGPPAATVKAEGNAFTGGLKFDPASVTVRVGDTVQWVNTDNVVPHTATEDHGLWDLTGTYGQTPANPPGFGPGETRERVFEAGTAHYYCKVHPQQMHGVVSVPVELSEGALVTAARSTHRRHRRGHHRRTSEVVPHHHRHLGVGSSATGLGVRRAAAARRRPMAGVADRHQRCVGHVPRGAGRDLERACAPAPRE